jgi:hypothetical protein
MTICAVGALLRTKNIASTVGFTVTVIVTELDAEWPVADVVNVGERMAAFAGALRILIPNNVALTMSKATMA